MCSNKFYKKAMSHSKKKKRPILMRKIRMAIAVAVIVLTAWNIKIDSYRSNNRNEQYPSYNYEKSDGEIVSGNDGGCAEALKNDIETLLFMVDNNTPYTSDDGTDGCIGGMYTGRVSENDSSLIEIDYKDEYVMISIEDAVPVGSAEILPVGVISQLDESTNGWSACGAACLHMLQRSIDIDMSYTYIVKYAEENGYSDQGSLVSFNGGISSYQMQELAEAVYGQRLINAYSDFTKPSEILKALINDGKQAIVLCKYKGGEILSTGNGGHFILVTGYIELDKQTTFIYADSYYSDDISHGNPLMHVSGDLLDQSVSADFDEPNAILYFAE